VEAAVPNVILSRGTGLVPIACFGSTQDAHTMREKLRAMPTAVALVARRALRLACNVAICEECGGKERVIEGFSA
jgi:hypothetical protein